jgi:hypothetical protein
MPRAGWAALALLAWTGAAILPSAPAWAVESATIDRFVRLSDRFHARLPKSRVSDLPAAARQERAVCILSRFEADYGPEGVKSLMRLMNVLSKGAEFDDPTIVAFNERYGSSYNRTEKECTGRALRS